MTSFAIIMLIICLFKPLSKCPLLNVYRWPVLKMSSR